MLRAKTPVKRAHIRRALEVAGVPVLRASLWFTRLYRPGFHETSPILYGVADRARVYPLIDHYHEPLAFPVGVESDYTVERLLPGIDLRVSSQLQLLERFDYREELLAIPNGPVDEVTPYYDNPSYPPADAQVLYGMVRWYRPRHVIEIGSGQSSRFIARALQANRVSHSPGTLTCIEPYEAPYLDALGATVRRCRLQDVPLEHVTRTLSNQDILVIDSSHVARPGGDVPLLYGELLPQLPPGVLVHVHDIFTPRNYPVGWIRRRWLWDEQYILEALLTHNPNLEIIVAVNHLYHEYSEELKRACPAGLMGPSGEEPSSIWLRVV